MAPFPILEFSYAIRGKRGGIVMLVGYFDESGTHDQSKVVSIAGLVGDTLEWSRLERPWKENLATSRIPVFHASQRQGLSDGLWDSLIAGLCIAIGDRDLFVVGSSISRDDWDRCAPPGLKALYQDNPYHFCFVFTMQQINQWSKDHGGGEPVALVFAEQKEYMTQARNFYEIYRESDEYNKLGSFSWGKPQCLIQLQAADLIAFETYHNIKDKLAHGDGNYTVRLAVQRIRKTNRAVQRMFNCGGLIALAKDLGV